MNKKGLREADNSEDKWLPKWGGVWQNILCVGLIYLGTLILFGSALGDKVFSDSGDSATFDGWSAAIDSIAHAEKTDVLWMPYVFSGMPVTPSLIFPENLNHLQHLLEKVALALYFGSKMQYMMLPFLLGGMGMFMFGRMLGFSRTLSLFTAAIFFLNPYAVGLPETGHGSKIIVLGYIPWVFLCAFGLVAEQFARYRLLFLGGLSVAVGTLLLSRHPQMALYGLMIIGLYVLYEFIVEIRQNPKSTLVGVGFFGVAVALGFAMYAYQAIPTLEYAQYSIRGAAGESGSGGALSYEYATNWSFHPFEMMNLIIPSFFGFENPLYWGWMPFTNSTVYVGLAPLLLAMIAIIFRRNRFTWFLIIVTGLFFLISFGKHFGLIYDLMFNYLPYFNKLRVPVMILHTLPILIGLLAAFGVVHIIELGAQAKELQIQKWKKGLLKVLIVAGAIFVFGLILHDMFFSVLSGFMFEKEGEMGLLRQQYGTQAAQALAQFKKLRFDLFWKDYVKFTILLAAIIGLIIAYLTHKIRRTTFLSALIIVTIIDLVIYDVRYINPKPFEQVKQQRFAPNPTLDGLQAEAKQTPFRVLDPTGRLDQDNSLLFRQIESVEGYSPAKLRIYQEVRDSCFRVGNRNVFNMLNVKYLVSSQQSQNGSVQTVAQPNPDGLPRAWFVDNVVTATSKQGVFAHLGDESWNPRTTAILEEQLPAAISPAGSASVATEKHASRHIILKTATSAPALLVLSEVYYPAGWKAFIDGVETKIYKTNYILRSVIVPAGDHRVEMKFEPQSFEAGLAVTNAAWAVALMLIVVGAFRHPAIRARFGRKTAEERKTPASA